MDALIDLKQKDDDCLDDEVDRNWAEILNQTYSFDRLEKHVHELEKMTQTKAVAWFKKYTHPNNEKYRKLSIKVINCTSTIIIIEVTVDDASYVLARLSHIFSELQLMNMFTLHVHVYGTHVMEVCLCLHWEEQKKIKSTVYINFQCYFKLQSDRLAKHFECTYIYIYIYLMMIFLFIR